MAEAMTMTQLLREVERLRARLAESEAAPAEDQDEPASPAGGQGRYRELFESSRDAILVTTRHGDIVDVNPAALELFGWSREEMRALNFSQLYADLADGQRFVAEIERNGSVRDFAVKLRGQDGREMDCLVTATVRRGPDGSISGYQGIIRDISQQKRALERLRENETRYRTLFETANDAIFLMQNGLFVDCNGRTMEMFGCAKDQIVGQDPARFSPERQSDGRLSEEKARENMEAAQSGRPQFFEWRHSTLDGQEFEAEVSLNRITLSDQSFLLAVVRDITARKKAENALRESEERFRLLSENAPDIIYTVALDGSFTYVNPAWERLLGHRPEEVLSRHFTDFAEPEEARRYVRLFKHIRDEKETLSDVDGRLIAKDGSVRHFSLSGSPDLDAEGQVIGMIGLFKDITARRQAERELEIQKAYLEQFIENSAEAIVLLDTSDRIILANKEFIRLFGYSADEVKGRLVNDLIVPESLRQQALDLTLEVARGRRVAVEAVRRREDGSLVDVSILGTPILIEGGQVGVYGIYRDITARKKAENALRESEERHRTVLEASPDPVAVYNSTWKMTYVNPAFSEVFGWTLEECLGRNIDFVPQEYLSDMKSALGTIVKGGTISGIESRRWTKDRRLIDVGISAAAFFDDQGSLQGSVVTFQDITERKRTEEQLKFIAYHDPLTGLPNRKSFYEHIEDRLIRSRRNPTRRWALLFLDLDRFKDVNDTLGHDVGDELLKAASRRIQSCLRKSDYMFRLGGDEFTILATNLTKDIHAATVAERILKGVARPFHIFGHEVYITGSIGISVHPEDGDSVEGLVKNADLAMYVAKEEANNYRFYAQEMNERALERLSLDSSLRQAAQRNQLVIHYQPLVDQERRIVGLEALLRWRHPELGLIHPDRFIPLAEETGAIIGIGEWVLATACRQVQQWRLAGREELFIAVNLSARQFKQPDLVETVRRVLEETGLPAECLQLELTETSVMTNPEEAVAKMRELHQEGIRFSIDDFGTGYSSLNYLKRFPVDTLKIDRSFVREATSNAEDQEIIRAIISMARNLSMEPLAEGVESREQQEFLAEHGCEVMQGFFFGRPVPGEEIDRLLTRKRI